jgi:hypothetical protein
MADLLDLARKALQAYKDGVVPPQETFLRAFAHYVAPLAAAVSKAPWELGHARVRVLSDGALQTDTDVTLVRVLSSKTDNLVTLTGRLAALAPGDATARAAEDIILERLPGPGTGTPAPTSE